MKKIMTVFVLSLWLLGIGSQVRANEQRHVSVKGLSSKGVLNNIESVLNVLKKNYVYPEVAQAMSAFVTQQVALGHYRDIDSIDALIIKLEADLRASSHDGHISLHRGRKASRRKVATQSLSDSRTIFRAERINSDVGQKSIGFIQFNIFSAKAHTKERIVMAMKELRLMDALIIDLRNNGGGDPSIVAFLSSLLVGENVHLWSVLDRQGETLMDAISHKASNQYKGQVCLLISKKTYSAAEAFAYTMKHLNRACVVGEPSGGGAHLVQMEPVNNDIDIRIPVARAYNRITKSNWEGVGVIPTISVNPSQAKAEAINYLMTTPNVSP